PQFERATAHRRTLTSGATRNDLVCRQDGLLTNRRQTHHISVDISHFSQVNQMLDTSILRILDSHVADEPTPAAEPVEARERVYFDAYPEAVSSVVDTLGPAVVRVDTRDQSGGAGRGGVGSGVVISPDGLVLTNAHVVNGAKEIRLSDTEGRRTEARL